MRRPLLASTALLACIACAGSDTATGSAAFREDTVAGVVHAVNTGTPPSWRLERERVIGALGGTGSAPAPDEFGRIRWLALDGEGNVYVADQGAMRIQVFDTTGVHLRSIGRAGGGPGEFRTLQAIAFVGDTLLVEDPGNARMALLDRTGTHLGQWPMTRMSGTADWFHPLAADTVAMMDLVGDQRERGYVLLGPAGAVDTIVPPPRAERGVALAIACEDPERRISFWSDPLAPFPITAPAPGRRIVQAWSDTYRLPFLDAGGDTVRVVSHADAAPAIPDSMLARLDAEYAAWRADLPAGTSCDPLSRGEYEVLPFLKHVGFDERERMWVETRSAERRAWDVFSPDGRLLGRATVPERHEAVRPALRDDRVAVVEEAPEGHHQVVVYRLVKDGP